MNDNKTVNTFSIIIEWDNARLSEMDRARNMLIELYRQIDGLDPPCKVPPEVIIVFNTHEVNIDLIEKVVSEASKSSGVSAAANVHFHAAEGGRYYELKNLGARLTTGQILIFLDSDVIPESGWLAELLATLADTAVDVVGGSTYIESSDFYSKAFALFWFFPLRKEYPRLRKAHHFFANNVAFRRSVFEAYPFPVRRQSRGQCIELAETLVRNGIGLFIQERSRVSHPPPNGIRHFCLRAITQGHDRLLNSYRGNAQAVRRLRTTYWVFSSNMRRSLRNTRNHYRDVGLGVGGAMLAVLLALVYYLMMAFGELLTRISPGFVQRYLLV